MNVHTTIIAKAPVAGLVKTRLCPPCTFERAAEIALAAITDTIDSINTIAGINSTRRTLLLEGARQPWMPDDYAIVAQRGDGLGERLRNGFADLGPGVVTGMETPHVAHLLAGAIDHVRRGADVIGLAEDGGYWMIGLSLRTVTKIDAVFGGIPTSASTTGALQLQRLREVGDHVVSLPTARDLDTIDDLCAIADSGRPGRLAALANDTITALVAAGEWTRGTTPGSRRGG